MPEQTRRGFFRTASLTAAAAGAVAVVPGVLGSSGGFEVGGGSSVGSAGSLVADSSVVGSGPLMVFVRDVSAGEVSVLVGTRSATFVDRELVARLVGLAG